MSEWLPLEALAARLDLPLKWLREKADEGAIPSLVLPGRRRRFDPEQVSTALRLLADAARHAEAAHDGH